jgi:hypothetical protein
MNGSLMTPALFDFGGDGGDDLEEVSFDGEGGEFYHFANLQRKGLR